MLCPNCGKISRIQLQAGIWQLQCRSALCRRRYHFGLVLFDLGKWKAAGRTVPYPEDMVFPEPFAAELPVEVPVSAVSLAEP